MARIGIDATSLSTTGKGVSTYQYNLIKHLAKWDDRSEYLIFLNAKNQLPELPASRNLTYVKVAALNTMILEQCHMPRWFDKYKLDLLHTNTDRLPLLGDSRTVVCVFEIPDYRIKKGKHRASLYKRITDTWTGYIFPFSMQKASFIITSSRSTMNDLIEQYDVDPARMEVVYLAPAEIFTPAESHEEIEHTRRSYGAEDGYILHFSSTDPRDNTQTVLEAYSRALQLSNIKQKLIIAGNTGPVKEQLSIEINKLGISGRVVFPGYIPIEDLVSLYRGADVYMDASLYEGFGLQVTEAMACGVPVIVSNTTSLPEVTGNGGILVNADNQDGFTTALIDLLQDNRKRLELSNMAYKQSRLFSWEKTVSTTADVWDRVIGMK